MTKAVTDIPKRASKSTQAQKKPGKPKRPAAKRKKPSSPPSLLPPPPGYQPPRQVTPPKAEITQPSGHRARLLPLVDVGSRKFEELCDDIIDRGFPHLVRHSLKETNGAQQFGVDVEGFDKSGDTSVVISAKCYEVIRAWDFRPWIQDFLDHIDGHWKGQGVKHFVLAVTHECNDTDMNVSARALVGELAKRGIEFHLWNTKLISDLVSQDARLVDRYFGKFWVEAMSAQVGAASPAVEPAPYRHRIRWAQLQPSSSA